MAYDYDEDDDGHYVEASLSSATRWKIFTSAKEDM